MLYGAVGRAQINAPLPCVEFGELPIIFEATIVTNTLSLNTKL